MIVQERPRAGSSPSTWTQDFECFCENGHAAALDVEGLAEAWFDIANLECPKCQGAVERICPEQVRVECPFCRETWAMDLDEVGTAHTCYGGVEVDRYQAVGTSSYFRSLVRDSWSADAGKSLLREGRGDYWDVVTHFTGVRNFIKILRSNTIHALPTGYFGSRRRAWELKSVSRAVCLTETPLTDTDEIVRRFGAYGFAFIKRDLLHLGLSPALNLTRGMLRAQRSLAPKPKPATRHSGWHRRLVPFINVVEADGFDFLHEREWRVPGDIELSGLQMMLVMPDNFAEALCESRLASYREVAAWLVRHGRMFVADSLT